MRRRKRSKRSRLRGATPLAVLAAVALIAALVGGGLLLLSLPSGGAPADDAKTAVIVDQLSLTNPNPAFVRSARDTLKEAGYVVDYFPGQAVTVEFYRELPTRGYDLIVLRVHSARQLDPQLGRTEDNLALFTSEPYSATRYAEEQSLGRIGLATYSLSSEGYFGVRPDFITSDMKGDFGGATIIMMGCDGLRGQRIAQAFLDKGASAFISWTRLVSASHTDEATQRLLEYLQGFSPLYAVALTAQDVGPDPSTGAELRIMTREGA